MRLRKRGLDEAGDAFIALPGGLGTMEELLEVLSFKQLGLHDRPVVVLDALG
jgi:predicted Rossmann-fold nucleotide-binding protein